MPGGRKPFLFVLTFCLAATIARAQTRPGITVDRFTSLADLAASVSVQAPADVNQQPTCENLALPCTTPRTFTGFGFVLSASAYASEVFGVVGEVSGYPNAWASYEPSCDRAHSICAVNQTNHVRAALAGVKGRTRLIDGGTARGRFFAQVLVGPEWSDVLPRQRVVQPGVGYDGYFLDGLAYRVEWDYRLAPSAVRDLSTNRISAAIVIPLGSR
jgi:hypothetical protein